MTPSFAVHPSSHYQRLSTKLQKGHRDFEATERSAAAILYDIVGQAGYGGKAKWK